MTNFSMSLRRRRRPRIGPFGRRSGKRNSHLSSQVRARGRGPCIARPQRASRGTCRRPASCNDPLQPRDARKSALQSRFAAACGTHVRTFASDPSEGAPYLDEHMFPTARTSTLAQRALGALRLTRSFLLLEDDYDVDWEVDQNEHLQAPHPHRAPLRGRRRDAPAGHAAAARARLPLPRRAAAERLRSAPTARRPAAPGRGG